MFDNASNVKARDGATFITGSDSPVEEGDSSMQRDDAPRMFRGLKDSKFDTVFAKARAGSEMFKDTDNVELRNVKITLPRSGRESTEMETDIPPIRIPSVPAIPRPYIPEYDSEVAPTLQALSLAPPSLHPIPPSYIAAQRTITVTTQHTLSTYSEHNRMIEVENTTSNMALGVPSLVVPPLHRMISNPTPPSQVEVESTTASTMQHSPSAYSENNRMDDVENTTANTTTMSLSAYSAEPRTDEASVNKVPAHDELKKGKKFKRLTRKVTRKLRAIFT